MTLSGVVTLLDGTLGRFAGLALLLTWVVGGLLFLWLRRLQRQEHEELSQTLRTLRYEIDEGRQMFSMSQSAMSGQPSRNGSRVSRPQYEMELEAYRDIWNAISELHRALGLFLRSVDNRERVDEYRQHARVAAKEARDVSGRLIPFYHESIEPLVTALLDRYIYLHLSACSYLDGQSGESLPEQQGVTLAILRERTRALFDEEAQHQLMELARAIRRRTVETRLSD
ncbi:hypothetical protein [Mangrovitalea sediminis]|uniref:hypothetical protein n=1 Tax=Mangrovitalea sediminis TaxID=1982043 RepID=UPI000BE62069|nr:hypothetical protein [Mangrovitalea sediminis]